LNRHRTRRGQALNLELHHREFRERYEARRHPHPLLPLTAKCDEVADGGSLQRAKAAPSVPASPYFESFAPDAPGLES
jgi:hypothetical protein